MCFIQVWATIQSTCTWIITLDIDPAANGAEAFEGINSYQVPIYIAAKPVTFKQVLLSLKPKYSFGKWSQWINYINGYCS